MLITQNKFIEATEVFDTTVSNSLSAGLWIYYIQGTLETFGVFKLKNNIGAEADISLFINTSGSSQQIQSTILGWTISIYNLIAFIYCGNWIKDSNGYWDDGNSSNGDEWNYNCFVENGWLWSTYESNRQTNCHVICGDGLVISPYENCDDGNEVSLDGWSAVCKTESLFTWTTNNSLNPASTCKPNWGDGKRVGSEEWDDNNIINGDGCSSLCKIENGYSWKGGTLTTKDTWVIVCGDGVSLSSDPTSCDDGNIVSGDGCSQLCRVEFGFKWGHTLLSTPDTCEDIWGDGINVKSHLNYCDDGNFKNGDGWSSNWVVEVSYTWAGGSSKHKDDWVEIWGDGKDFGTYEWDDGNLKDGDGWSSSCEYEYCYACSGGTLTSPDKWYNSTISASIGEVSTSNSVLISFNSTMLNASITQKDLLVTISGNYNIDFTWTTTYQSTKSLLIQLNINTVLQGGETLTVKFINSKVFRGPDGG